MRIRRFLFCLFLDIQLELHQRRKELDHIDDPTLEQRLKLAAVGEGKGLGNCLCGQEINMQLTDRLRSQHPGLCEAGL